MVSRVIFCADFIARFKWALLSLQAAGNYNDNFSLLLRLALETIFLSNQILRIMCKYCHQ